MGSPSDMSGRGRGRCQDKRKGERHVLGTAQAFLDAIGAMEGEGGPEGGICECNGSPQLADMSGTNEVGVAALWEVEVGKYLSKKLWGERIGRCERVLEGMQLDYPRFCAENHKALFRCFAGDILANVVGGDKT
ncbi:hypothetical protein GSI_07176 [Ganoderma sinense ZZ0214-1]|uniref:Uncharacterized protein n=1 Tax=Ganoderma sinense ZZ0214-1 TaxID=1077348 RepID=A0A2G8S9P4_9APHY|nr:hypothetical protein GSI_07176 [Ganoderma sinense ZZ0214-1]